MTDPSADRPAEDLDALVRRVDPDRWLSSRFIADPQARADVIAVYAYDHELGRAPKAASNPILGEIRLTWWREVLDEIFEARPVRHHPTAQALAGMVERRAVGRAPLEAMIDARYRELDPAPLSLEEAVQAARGSAGGAAVIAAEILAPGASGAEAAGAAWAFARRIATAPLEGAPERLRALRREAAEGVRRLPVAAFPAAAHGALACLRARGGETPELIVRLRLLTAVATGRI